MGDELVIEIEESLKEWKTPKEAAELLGVTERSVQRWCCERIIKSVRLGGRWRIKI